MKYPDVAKRFTYILTLRNLKQNELAEKANINRSFISHYVNGTHCPSTEKAQLLAEVLNVNPLWLMGLADVMDKEKPTALSDEQLQFLTLFDSLSNSHQKTALEHLMFLKAQESQSSENQTEN